MRDVSKQEDKDFDLQSISEWDTEHNSTGKRDLRGVRAAVDGNILGENAEQYQSRDYLDKTDLPKYSYDWFAAKPDIAKKQNKRAIYLAPIVISIIMIAFYNE